jgi:hypothetical protein
MNNDQSANPGSNSAAPTTTSSVIPPNKSTNPKSSSTGVILLSILLAVSMVAAIGAAVWGIDKSKKLSEVNSRISAQEKTLKEREDEIKKFKESTGEANINKDGYQSVFLKGGQVYFGKITSITETQVVLEDIYYLRANGSEQSLVKLGNELHGPEDKMNIERKEVEFWENIKDDGQVVKAIREYQKSNP